jgi:hypothetical protein
MQEIIPHILNSFGYYARHPDSLFPHPTSNDSMNRLAMGTYGPHKFVNVVLTNLFAGKQFEFMILAYCVC